VSGFKAFLLRGNLVELAVAFIMGAAFATVVTAFTDMLMAAIAKVIGANPNFDSWVLLADDNGQNGIPFGSFLTALVAFLILAAVVYFAVIVPYQKAKSRFFPDQVEEEGVSEEVALLTQIRDALVAGGGTGTGGSHAGQPTG
jgi:large conductance mechanosensitive channel